MESNVKLFSISEDFIAAKLTTISNELFVDLKQFFKLRESSCRYVVCTGFDHIQKGPTNSYKYDFYEILDSDFLPLTQLDGIYQLRTNKMIEGWKERWSNTIISFEFQSNMFDKYQVGINTIANDKIKIAQQIAIILQVINGKSEIITEDEIKYIRKRLDEYRKVKRI